MTCKDCLHYEVCIRRQNSISLDPMKCGYKCPEFKNKAEFAEVKRMQWIKKTHVSKDYKQCPVCKYDFSRLIPDNFCPNCGAKKEG